MFSSSFEISRFTAPPPCKCTARPSRPPSRMWRPLWRYSCIFTFFRRDAPDHVVLPVLGVVVHPEHVLGYVDVRVISDRLHVEYSLQRVAYVRPGDGVAPIARVRQEQQRCGRAQQTPHGRHRHVCETAFERLRPNLTAARTWIILIIIKTVTKRRDVTVCRGGEEKPWKHRIGPLIRGETCAALPMNRTRLMGPLWSERTPQVPTAHTRAHTHTLGLRADPLWLLLLPSCLMGGRVGERPNMSFA